MTLDVAHLREDFPILRRKVHGRRLVYLDNAATSQKPQAVIDRVRRYYEEENANIHRGVHLLSEAATREYEGARARVARFLNATPQECVFVRGTTEAINLVANTFVRARLQKDDEVVVTQMEHHSNIVPWQLLCEQVGARLRVVPITDAGEIDLAAYSAALGPRTRFVSVVHVSNALGTVNPVQRLVQEAHAKGIPVLLDGAQAVPHMPVDVRALGCDFYAFSGHKMYGPTGIGVLYGKREHLEAMPPWMGGGDMIRSVTFEKSTWNEVPHKFEAGTPHIAGGIGLGAAVEYLERVGLVAIAEHEHRVLEYATEQARSVPGLRLIGTAASKAGVLSFNLDGVHPHDVGSLVDRDGVAIRTGHHCAQPVMERFGVPATCRASLGLYNGRDDIDALAGSLKGVVRLFA
ncbi:MAG TPA: cysteine desulfurase [Candidatus Thermoplasmatota archaeon]|nr:cysteine desulfurase [Candidatus Thermoplasmatota archaeon]